MPLTFDIDGCVEYCPLFQIDKRECVGNSVDAINYNTNQIDLVFERIFGWCSKDPVDCVPNLMGCLCNEPVPLDTKDGFIYGDGESVCFLDTNSNCGIPAKSGGQYKMIECGESCSFFGVDSNNTLGFFRIGIPQTASIAANGKYGYLIRFSTTDFNESIDVSGIMSNFPDTTQGCCGDFPIKAFVTVELQDKGSSDSFSLVKINDWEIQGTGLYTGPYTTVPYPMEVVLRDQKYLDINVDFTSGTSSAQIWIFLNKIEYYC